MTTTASLPFQLTKTLVCALYELQAISNVDPSYFPNTTLNYKYNIFPTELPVKAPKLRYFGIGIRGFKNLDDQNLAAPYVPSAKNLDLYTPLPFRVVPIDNDLTPAERLNYRMRVMKTIDNVSYWCYYLKKLSFVDNSVNIIKTNLLTSEETTLNELDSSDLTPTPVNTSAEGTIETTEKISVALTAGMQITGEEVIEAINVLYGGNLLKAVVSEIGIYCGDDQEMTMNDGLGGTFVSDEAIFASLCYHYCSLGTSFGTPSHVENLAIRLASASAFLI